MTKNPLVQLHSMGQSFWFDGLSRQMIEDGTIKRLIDDDGLRGITSNPTIFAEALSNGSKVYDDIIAKGADAGRAPEQIFDEIAKKDIEDACDLLRPVFDEADGHDGFVSLEESPRLAHDTRESVAEGVRLHKMVDRPNLLVKVPATPEGIPAVHDLIVDGWPVNVTLMFSVEQYRQVAEAYISAIEERARRGLNLDVPSVASIFVSRIDAKIDPWIDDGVALQSAMAVAEEFRGKTAVINARECYRLFKALFHSDRFAPLSQHGAHPQRLLFASTSTKDPAYSDTKYPDALIGPETVVTMPMATVDAFRDHGTVESTLEEHAVDLIATHKAGIDVDRAMAELLDEGVDKFAKSYDELIGLIESKMRTEAGARR